MKANESSMLKFIYSEKATNFCEISTVDLSYVVTVKYTVEMLQNFVAFSEYMNISSRFWPLAPQSRDLSQAEKEITACKADQIHKMTTIVQTTT